MEKERFEMQDKNGNIRVFEWNKKRGSVDILKKGTDINERINYQKGSFDHDPVSTLDEAKIVAKDFLISGVKSLFLLGLFV